MLFWVEIPKWKRLPAALPAQEVRQRWPAPAQLGGALPALWAHTREDGRRVGKASQWRLRGAGVSVVVEAAPADPVGWPFQQTEKHKAKEVHPMSGRWQAGHRGGETAEKPGRLDVGAELDRE